MPQPIRILLLEDNPFDAELNQRILKKSKLDFELLHVDNKDRFLEALDNFAPDIVLSDFSVPQFNGFKALKATRESGKNTPFIVVTGAIGEETSVLLLKKGATDYILKDRLARLPDAIHKALEDTEQKRKLEASEERYQLLSESSHYGVWDWNIAEQTLYLSPQWKQQLGYQDHELENSYATFERLLHPDDIESVRSQIQTFLSAPTQWDVEFRMQHKNGEIRWINARASFTTDSDGNVNRMLGIHIDITRRREAEERLRQAAQVFSSTIEGVTITDTDGTILDVNPAFTLITGYTREQALGQNPRLLKSGRHSREFYQTMWESLTAEGQWSGEIWNRRADGSVYPELLTISAVKNENGQTTGYVGVFTDITKSKRTEARLEFLAHHDPLTRLPNRLLFNARLSQAVRHAQRLKNQLAILFIDLDRFKNINDSLGHAIGDDLLKQVAQRLKQAIRSDDTVARISGDEFIVMLENLSSTDSATNVLNKIMDAFRIPFKLFTQEVLVTCSVGLSIYPNDGRSPGELMRNADAAMYRAKDEGRNTYEFYTPEMTEAAFEHVFLENALHGALSQRELIQFYQPQYQLQDMNLVGCETLIRWQHPQQGMIPPQRFIPVAEQNGLIRDIDTWMLRTACTQGKAWAENGFLINRIAVNMTGSQIQRKDFADNIIRILEETQFPVENLEIEVTESFVMQRPESGIEQLSKLYEKGVSIAIDDFGTGYSSLSYLKKLPVNKIKLDQSFIKDINTDEDTLAIVAAITGLAKALGKTIVAEGVETFEQGEKLKQLGCEQAQGYYFSHPIDVDNMSRLLESSIIEKDSRLARSH